jgi:hypothetical protein
MNWRAESTGSPLPLSRSATQLAEIMAKLDRPCEFRPPGMRVPPPIMQRPGQASSHLLFPCCYKAQGSRVAIRVMAMTKSKTLIFCPPHHCRRAADERDELAPSHSITSSARATISRRPHRLHIQPSA